MNDQVQGYEDLLQNLILIIMLKILNSKSAGLYVLIPCTTNTSCNPCATTPKV